MPIYIYIYIYINIKRQTWITSLRPGYTQTLENKKDSFHLVLSRQVLLQTPTNYISLKSLQPRDSKNIFYWTWPCNVTWHQAFKEVSCCEWLGLFWKMISLCSLQGIGFWCYLFKVERLINVLSDGFWNITNTLATTLVRSWTNKIMSTL